VGHNVGVRRALLLAAIPGLLGVWACQRRAETPPDVARAYRDLVASLDESAPGASLSRLQDFARPNERYAISPDVEAEMEVWRAKLEPAYRKSRDLVRAERFDEAETILKDLAPLENERAGKLAREFLAFDFLHLKASRLLMRGDIAGAQAVARQLRSKPLTAEQVAATERLLDAASTVDVAAGMTAAAAFQAAARSLQVHLQSAFAEEGRYPGALTLDSPSLAGLRAGGSFAGVAAIEDYVAGPDAFSFVLTGKDPGLRLRVTQSGIEPAGGPAAARQPATKAVAGLEGAPPGLELDSPGAAARGVRMTRVTPFQTAARSLQLMLHSTYAEEGRFPATLSLDSPLLANLRGNNFFNGVAAIEDYVAGPETFSFVLKGKDPRQRLRVTQSSIEEVGAPTRP
jgi:hypothetical protein